MTTRNGDGFENMDEEQRRVEEESAPREEPKADKEPLSRFAWLKDELRSIEARGGVKWLSEKPPRREYLLATKDDRGVLAAGRVALLAAAGGAGKSYALCQLALAVAVAEQRQQHWLGTFEVRKGGRVLLVMGEEEEAEIRRRLYNAARVARLDERDFAAAAANIVPMGLAGKDDVALTRELERGEQGTTATDFAELLLATLESSGPWTCILVDPLSRFAGGDVEKDNAAATRLVQVLERFTHLPGNPTVIVAHHTRKGGKDDDGSKGVDDVRGASGLKDGARFVAVLEDVERVDEKQPRLARFRVVKNNYGTWPPATVLARDEAHEGALRLATGDEVKRHEDARRTAEKKPDAKRKADDEAPEPRAPRGEM